MSADQAPIDELEQLKIEVIELQGERDYLLKEVQDLRELKIDPVAIVDDAWRALRAGGVDTTEYGSLAGAICATLTRLNDLRDQQASIRTILNDAGYSHSASLIDLIILIVEANQSLHRHAKTGQIAEIRKVIFETDGIEVTDVVQFIRDLAAGRAALRAELQTLHEQWAAAFQALRDAGYDTDPTKVTLAEIMISHLDALDRNTRWQQNTIQALLDDGVGFDILHDTIPEAVRGLIASIRDLRDRLKKSRDRRLALQRMLEVAEERRRAAEESLVDTTAGLAASSFAATTNNTTTTIDTGDTVVIVVRKK